MTETMSLEKVLTKQSEIAKLASKEPKWVLTTLAHRIDLDWMLEAYRRTRKKGAVGVDGVTAKEYEENLLENLSSLLERFKSGSYRAPAVRRVYIEKDGGQSRRPIGIPTLEDKILQRAVLMVLEPIYEQDFLDCSYGFRPERSAHQALNAVWDGLMRLGGCWIIDLDIRQYFDRVDRTELNRVLDQRVRDGVIRRAVGKWLHAGVMEEGVVFHPEYGMPQGGVISPILSNVFLHEILDTWFEDQVKPRLSGRAFMVRFADDAVLCFSSEEDVRRMMEILPKRFERFGLELNEQKTKLIHFRPTPTRHRERGSQSVRCEGFDFLAFTHFWGRSRKGRWIVKKKTAKGRFGRSLKRVIEWCRLNRHLPVRDQHASLVRKLKGHYAYFGVTGNIRALSRFRREVERGWCKWLSRRSHKAGTRWERFSLLIAQYPLPNPRVVRSSYHSAAKP